MLTSARFRFSLFLMSVGLGLGLGLAPVPPATSHEPHAYGERLVAQYELPPQAIARYADMAAGTAAYEARRDGSRFADASPWVGPEQRVGAGQNPYTVVFTVRGTAGAAGEVSARWQAGWEVDEPHGARLEVLTAVPDTATTTARAGAPVTLTASSDRISFRGVRTVAPKLGLVQMHNLHIDEVQLQVWSGAAPLAWPTLPVPSIALLALAAAFLLFSVVRRNSQPRSAAPALTPLAQRFKRSELPTTSNELAAMPRPAAHGGNAPNSASGTHTAL